MAVLPIAMSTLFGSILLLFVGTSSASTFYSQLQPCPAPCSILGPSSTNWTLYSDINRLNLCNETVLFDFTVFNSLGDPNSQTSVRACTADAALSANTIQSRAPYSSCGNTSDSPATLQVASWGSGSSEAGVNSAISSVQSASQPQSSCGPTFSFAYNDGSVVGIYVGQKLDSEPAISKLSAALSSASAASESFVAQICGQDRDGDHTAGLVASATGDFELVQTAVQSWANASCLTLPDAATASTSNISISQMEATPPTTSVSRRGLDLESRSTCSYVQVVSGDSCGSLTTKCGISASDFNTYNPGSTLCSTLAVGEAVCCSSGSLPDFTPQPNPDGTCASYTVASGDYCSLIATNNYITVDELETYNAETWGWQGCSNVQLGQVICLSSGSPPMPAVVSNAVCGPQVAGTTRPASWSDISLQNPCSLNACCDVWGQCGITPDFCTATTSASGAPGTAPTGSNGCISNCGTEIVNKQTSSETFNIGYFEGFNDGRACLNMAASQIPSTYSHIHFAFAQVTFDYEVDLTSFSGPFAAFVAQTGYKKVLSFGGWSFSTSSGTFAIFREGVTDANRLRFAQSVVATVAEYGLDGVDFDWEYPGAPDIPGIPSGSPTDGANYLSFITTLRSLLPAGKTISIAAPASYWYLKGFEIAAMSEVVDYIVYMTYDLHGQWDYENIWSNPGCPTGNCLRSHVNLTETEYSLAMITKAGVPTNKIVVGIASYGRSFGMMDTSCTGPTCLFTGPDSTATEGDCTGTAGYISQAELDQLASPSSKHKRGVTTWKDASSDTDMATYGDGTWVAYMSDATKASRQSLYLDYGFAGSVEWAIDLQQFMPGDAGLTGGSTSDETYFLDALSQSNYDLDDFTSYNLSDLATRLIGYDGCTSDQKTAIYSGWQQSWKIMNYMYKNPNIDFNAAAAVEYLGPPSLNGDQQAAFKHIYQNLATIQPGYFGFFAWKLAVRCDDPNLRCPCLEESGNVVAYTTNNDPKYNTARINFCPRYFALPTLDTAIQYGNDRSLDASWWANMNTYVPNQAKTWIHELLHVDWVSKAESYGSNKHVTDIKMKLNTADGPRYASAYGPQLCKSLARWGVDTGSYIVRNADSLTMYAMARYVQNALGNIYPHLPLGPAPPTDVDVLDVPDYFSVDANGVATVDDTTEFTSNEWTPTGVCSAPDDEDADAAAANQVTMSAAFAAQTEYPADYLSSWSSWAGLTTSTATTTAATAPTYTPSYDCQGSALCKTLQVKYCDHAVNSLLRNDDLDYGTGENQLTGNCWGDVTGDGCGVFVQGTPSTGGTCEMSGNEMWNYYQLVRNTGDCSTCGSYHVGNGCLMTINYVTGCDNS